jgi:ankyrin repeat protein
MGLQLALSSGSKFKISGRDAFENTALHHACLVGSREALALLFTHSAPEDVVAVNKMGENILHTAVQTGIVELVAQVMAREELDLQARTRYGLRAIDMADEEIRLLISSIETERIQRDEVMEYARLHIADS